MASARDTATFFLQGNSQQFEHVLSLYPQALKLKAEARNKKPEELIKLDNWYQNELPKKIKSRGKDAHLVHEELVQTMKWKQTRGKFFPQLSFLIKVNTPRAVMAETKKAFRKLPNLEQAITALTNLKGVGTTMASALLAAAAPDSAPFMADECLMAIPEIEGIDYTTKEYLNFVTHIQATTNRLNLESTDQTNPTWSPHRVELALWTHYIAADLQPDLLADIPGCTISSAGRRGLNGASNGDLEPSDESNQEMPANGQTTNGKLPLDSVDDSTTSFTEDSLDKPATPIIASDETNDSIASDITSLKRSAPDIDECSRTSSDTCDAIQNISPSSKKLRTDENSDSTNDIVISQAETTTLTTETEVQ